jgi:hypothetical protein
LKSHRYRKNWPNPATESGREAIDSQWEAEAKAAGPGLGSPGRKPRPIGTLRAWQDGILGDRGNRVAFVNEVVPSPCPLPRKPHARGSDNSAPAPLPRCLTLNFSCRLFQGVSATPLRRFRGVCAVFCPSPRLPTHNPRRGTMRLSGIITARRPTIVYPSSDQPTPPGPRQRDRHPSRHTKHQGFTPPRGNPVTCSSSGACCQ